MVELLVVQRSSPHVWIRELIVLFADEHHDADRIVVECYASGLWPCAHLNRIAHMPLVQLLTHDYTQ